MNRVLNKYLNLIVIFAGIINLGVVLVFDISCPWKENFDIDCAGCGATRMFRSLFSLDFYQAFRFNPLMFCLVFIGVIYLIYYFICVINHKNYYKIKNRDWLILLGLVVAFTIIRNIPIFSWLKPTIVR